ncbi:MAG: hypothetical protein PHV06_10990, partial [bacterium]|nr:hypothetical protein [bacterium]
DPENEDIKEKIRELQKQREEIAKRSVAPKIKVASVPSQPQVQKIPVKKKSKFPVFLVLGLIFIAVVIAAGVLVVVLDPFNLNLLNKQNVVGPNPNPTPNPTPTPPPIPTPPPVAVNEYLKDGPNKGEVYIISSPQGSLIYVDNKNTEIKTNSKIYLPLDKEVSIRVKYKSDFSDTQNVKLTKKKGNSSIKFSVKSN